MPTTEERVNRLENIMIELADAQMRTQLSLKNLSDEMQDFKNEMRGFKDEMLDFKDEMRGFKDEMLSFKDEMREFKDEMLNFKDEMREFKDEMLNFKDEMLDFKDEMRGFKDEMLNFKDEMRGFKDEMLDFKDEMREFKDEAKTDRKQMNKQWGELANKMGTIVEDIVAPNIPRIAMEYFGFSDIEDFMVRRQVRNKKDRAKRREFDVIAVGENQVIINETKSTPRIDYIDAFIEVLAQIEDYFPEYAGKKIIPIFASLYIGEDVVNYLTRNKIYAMGMGEETMELLNFRQVSNGR